MVIHFQKQFCPYWLFCYNPRVGPLLPPFTYNTTDSLFAFCKDEFSKMLQYMKCHIDTFLLWLPNSYNKSIMKVEATAGKCHLHRNSDSTPLTIDFVYYFIWLSSKPIKRVGTQVQLFCYKQAQLNIKKSQIVK